MVTWIFDAFIVETRHQIRQLIPQAVALHANALVENLYDYCSSAEAPIETGNRGALAENAYEAGDRWSSQSSTTVREAMAWHSLITASSA
jgi:hypothetical protein